MPHIKNALLRFRIIDRALRNQYKPYPSKAMLREACEEALFGGVDGENICDSTIEKDMFAMKMEHDAPIKYSKKYGGYYYSDEGFSLDEIPLNESDIEAIRFAANTLSQFKDVGMFRQFGFAIDKIVDRVNISNDINDKSIERFVEFETPVSSRGSEFLNPILTSIKDGTILYFDYESFQTQKRKARKVLPLLLKEYRNRWYLLCYDLVKEDIITYGLDRIYDLQKSEEVFRSPVSFNPDQFFEHAIGITASNGKPETVVFKADNVAAKYIESQPFHASQKMVKEGKNKSTFEMNVFISEELIRALLSYGGELIVLEPPLLVDHMVQRVKAMVENYQYKV
ncbi:WYL domain-containing protein [Fluviicola sp.]|uniref:helix-turn-helix transcriptional regulator n=1 Tax=Fluviicola sp. TaxID=1917219 RepID=UPI0031E16611